MTIVPVFSSQKSRLALFGRLMVLCLILGLGTSFVRADEIDDLVKQQMEADHIPGLSIAVVHKGKIVKLQGYGVSDLEKKTPVTPQTMFKIASVSKQFIASAIVLLAADGKLNLNDSMTRYFPDAPETWKPITLKHLLSHTSGLVRESPAFHPIFAKSDLEIVKATYPVPMKFQPGERWEYCNVGYFALADIIRQVSGKPWPEFCQERIFAKAGMPDTFATNAVPEKYGTLISYSWDENTSKKATEFATLRPSGAFASTVVNLANWELSLQQGKVLSKKLQELMHQPTVLNDGFPYPYGFGWETDTINAVARVRHGGSLGGFRTEFMRFPDEKLAVIVLSNQDSANPMKIASLVATTVLPNLKYRPIKDTDPAFSATVKKLLESWAEGTADSSIFTPASWKVFEPRFKNPNAIKGFKSLGPITDLSLVESRQTGDFRITRHRITFASQTQLIQIMRTKAGLIADMRLENE